jgi:hypothetical protein
MFAPNLTAIWTPIVEGEYTMTGRPVLGDEQEIKLSMVRLKEGVKTSEKNEGGSGSEGYASEEIVLARLLIPVVYDISVGDKIVVGSIDFKISLIWPHYTVFGELDHYECDGVAWPG